MMNRLAALLLLLATGALAQLPPPLERRMVEVKHLHGPRLDQAARLLNDFMAPGDAKVYPDLNAVLLRGSADAITAGEALLHKFDTPGPAAQAFKPPAEAWQIRIYLVQAGGPDGQGGPIPQEIASAVDQMKKAFVYKTYRVLETVLVQAGARGATVSGLLPSPDMQNATYVAQFRELVPTDDGKMLLIRGFRCSIRRPFGAAGDKQTTFGDAEIQTELSIRPGQKLVVGKLAVAQTDSPIFLIITAEPSA